MPDRMYQWIYAVITSQNCRPTFYTDTDTDTENSLFRHN